MYITTTFTLLQTTAFRDRLSLGEQETVCVFIEFLDHFSKTEQVSSFVQVSSLI